MKLATYKDGSRDGHLVVVSRDLSTAHFATGTATRLQQVLDDWNFLSPQLQDLYVTLNQGKARHAFAFEPRQCMAPLPRAGQWAAARADGPAGASAPQFVQGASDDFLGPCDDAWFGSAAWGIDAEAGLAAITGDVGMGASPEQALDGVRLLLLVSDWRLRQLEADERAQGLAPLHSRPAAAFSPVAVTPDELGEAWLRGRVHAALQVRRNGRRVVQPEAAAAMRFHFGQLIAHLAKTRHLRAGCLVGSGSVGPVGPAERADAAAPAGVFQFGDTLRVEMIGRDGQSVFGAIEQRVTGPGMPADPADPADGDEAADAAGLTSSADLAGRRPRRPR